LLAICARFSPPRQFAANVIGHFPHHRKRKASAVLSPSMN
jgi:hypothetical protein